MAWGATKSDLNTKAIKQHQNRVDTLNEAETTDENRVEYLEVS